MSTKAKRGFGAMDPELHSPSRPRWNADRIECQDMVDRWTWRACPGDGRGMERGLGGTTPAAVGPVLAAGRFPRNFDRPMPVVRTHRPAAALRSDDGGLSPGPDRVESRFLEVDRRSDRGRTAIARGGTTVGSGRTAIARGGTTVGPGRTAIPRGRTAVGPVERRSDRVESRFLEVGRGSDRVESRFLEVGRGSDQVESRFFEVERRSDRVESRFLEVERRSDQVESRFLEVERRSDRVESRPDQVESHRPDPPRLRSSSRPLPSYATAPPSHVRRAATTSASPCSTRPPRVTRTATRRRRSSGCGRRRPRPRRSRSRRAGRAGSRGGPVKPRPPPYLIKKNVIFHRLAVPIGSDSRVEPS
jgi:hypothetical protein